MSALGIIRRLLRRRHVVMEDAAAYQRMCEAAVLGATAEVLDDAYAAVLAEAVEHPLD